LEDKFPQRTIRGFTGKQPYNLQTTWKTSSPKNDGNYSNKAADNLKGKFHQRTTMVLLEDEQWTTWKTISPKEQRGNLLQDNKHRQLRGQSSTENKKKQRVGRKLMES
jgi:hypothetical protein